MPSSENIVRPAKNTPTKPTVPNASGPQKLRARISVVTVRRTCAAAYPLILQAPPRTATVERATSGLRPSRHFSATTSTPCAVIVLSTLLLSILPAVGPAHSGRPSSQENELI